MRFADKAIWRLGQEASFEGCARGQPGGVAWGQWHAVGGIAAGPPALGRSMHDGTSIVFVRQADKQLYHKSQRPGHNGTRFEPDFELMRGAFAAGPALVQKASGLLEVLMQGVDRQLWQGDGFLTHGLAGGPHDAEQPALLVWDDAPASELPNAPKCLITLDGAEVGAAEAQEIERLCIVLDGTDTGAVVRARGLFGGGWRLLTMARRSSPSLVPWGNNLLRTTQEGVGAMCCAGGRRTDSCMGEGKKFRDARPQNW